nr:MobV family relaxase [Bacillus sp. BH32]
MLVARTQKMKSQNIGGIQKHNQREFDYNSNQKINKDLSHFNYDLVNSRPIDYRERVMSIIESQKTGTKAIRKDAVLVNEWIITSDQDFFKDLSGEDKQKFFESSLKFFEQRYGKQNMAYAQVHLDETTPHMHLGVVPMRDGRLQAKNVFNKTELLKIQKELPEYLREQGFNIDRGQEGSEKKHMSDKEYKEMHEKMSELKSEVSKEEKRAAALKEKNDSLDFKVIESKLFLETERDLSPKGIKTKSKNDRGEILWAVTDSEMQRLTKMSNSVQTVLANNAYLQKEQERLYERNKKLEKRINILEQAQEQASNILRTAQKHASTFAHGVFERAVTYAKTFYENDAEVSKESGKVFEYIHKSPEGIEDKVRWQKQAQQRGMFRER